MKLTLKDLKNVVKIAHEHGVSRLKAEGIELEFFSSHGKDVKTAALPTEIKLPELKDSDGRPLTPDDELFWSVKEEPLAQSGESN